jgi:hypothetical protein
MLASCVRTGSNFLQTALYFFAVHSDEITVKEHIILSIDERDAEEQRDLWAVRKISP